MMDGGLILFIEYIKHHDVIDIELSDGNFQLCGSSEYGTQCQECKVSQMCSEREESFSFTQEEYEYLKDRYPEHFI